MASHLIDGPIRVTPDCVSHSINWSINKEGKEASSIGAHKSIFTTRRSKGARYTKRKYGVLDVQISFGIHCTKKLISELAAF